MKSSFFLLIFHNFCLTMISCCHSDRNQDHRPRVNCTAMTLSSVPSSIDPATEVIVLTDNDFESVSWSSYQSFHKLHELDLSRNKVSALQSTSNIILSSLRVLRLSGNRLQELPASAFTAASKLMEIYLRANQLHTLNQDAFKNLEQLEVLDLSQNLIRVLPLPLLTVINTKILKTFDVEDNRLKVMPDQFFSKLPDIPYVYLSKNPWVCNCDVGYLSGWLEDQGHNVYVHTGPSNIVNDPESVVCDSPNQLKDRAIIDLTEDDYCSKPPLGDAESVVTAAPRTTAATTMTLSTAHILPSTQTPEVTQTSTVFNNQADTTTPALTPTTTSTQTTTTAPIQTSTDTPIPTTSKTQTSIRTTTPTQTPTTSARTFWLATTMYYLMWTSWHDFATSKTSLESVMTEESNTISAAFQQPTPVFKSTAQSTTLSTPRSTAPLTTPSAPQSTPPSTPAQHPTTDPSWTTKQSVSTGFVSLGSRIQERPVVYYCWWLFLCYLFLCILLIFWLCLTFLWALRAYLRVYLPLVRKKQEQRRNTLMLLGYYSRQIADTDGNGENLQSRGKAGDQAGAISLPFEGGEGVQAIFRSVLFVYRPEQTKEGEEEYEGVKPEYTCQDCTTGQDAGSLDIRSVENIQVHRKTIYKVVKREQELTGLTEVDLSQRANEGVPNEQGKRVTQGWSGTNRASSEPKKRYSLILREERVNGEERERGSINRESALGNEWIVGEWLLKDQEGAGADTREEDWWSLMPLIARGTDSSPRGGDGSSPPKIIISETQL